VLFDLLSIPINVNFLIINSIIYFSLTLNVPFGYFINDTKITSVGNKLDANKAIINEIEQTNVTK
jgi:hypothetical protein